MRYEIIDRNIIEKPSNEKNRNMDDQEALVNQEDFDYNIPKLKTYSRS